MRAASRRLPTAATEPALALLRCAPPPAPWWSRKRSLWCGTPRLGGPARRRGGAHARRRLPPPTSTPALCLRALSGDAAAQRAFLGAAAGRAFEDPFLHAALGGGEESGPLTLAAIKGYFDGPPSAHDATKRQLLLAALRAALADKGADAAADQEADAAAIAVKCRRMAEATSEDGDEDAEAAAFSLATAYLEDLGRNL